MALPTFLIVGAQKSGTTSLHNILSHHPEVYMSKKKEINYFTYRKNYNRGLSYYSAFFPIEKNDYQAIGEASPGYICYPGVADKIKEDLGIIKIVIILRDPIKRAYSQYWDNRIHLNEQLSEEQILEVCLEEDYIPGQRGYFSRGTYVNYIKNYIDLFGRINLYVIILEELIDKQRQNLQRLYEFLEVNPESGMQELPPPSNAAAIWKNPVYQFFFKHPEYTKYLPNRGKRILFVGPKKRFKYDLPDKVIIEKLKNFYKPFNIELSNLLNKSLTHWI